MRYYGCIPTRCAAGGAKQADEEVQTEGDAVEVIDVSAHEPRRIPSKKWRELIKKVWEADPLRCPKCSREMRIVSLIDEEDVIERILRHLGLWQEGGACIPAPTRGRNDPRSVARRPLQTPNRSWRSPPAETSGSAQVRLCTPCSAAPSPPARVRLPGPLLSLCAHGNARFRLQTPGQRPGGPKRFPISKTD